MSQSRVKQALVKHLLGENFVKQLNSLLESQSRVKQALVKHAKYQLGGISPYGLIVAIPR